MCVLEEKSENVKWEQGKYWYWIQLSGDAQK